jgi:hypothetical protein
MNGGDFPRSARFRRLKQYYFDRSGRLSGKRGKNGWLCTLPIPGDVELYAFGISRCSKRDMENSRRYAGKGMAYDRARRAVGLLGDGMEPIGSDGPLPRCGLVRREDVLSMIDRFNSERFIRDGWRTLPAPAKWEKKAWNDAC